MLAAVLEDLSRVPSIQPVTMLDRACQRRPSGTIAGLVGAGEEAGLFRELARGCDFTLVIAPEFDDLLYDRCRWVEEEGRRLLGPSPEAVRLTADKLALSRHLSGLGVPTPLCRPFTPDSPAHEFPLVCKPRQGAGSQATFLVRCPSELVACAKRAREEGCDDALILQPFVVGQPASVAFLIGTRERLALPAGSQELSQDGRFRYHGGTLPLPLDRCARATALARRAVAAVPGLLGYVGVDLVLGEATDGSRDQVIEINPRLTTSYVGLRALAHANLAEVMVCLATGEKCPALEWKPGTVSFRPDGTANARGSC